MTFTMGKQSTFRLLIAEFEGLTEMQNLWTPKYVMCTPTKTVIKNYYKTISEVIMQ